MARSTRWNGQILLALHERRETRDVLVLGRQAARKVAGVAADVVGRNLDAALADRRRPQQIDGKPSKMRQAVIQCDAFDRAADQRRGRPRMLMVGMPRATCKRTCAKDAVADFAVGCVHESLRHCAYLGLADACLSSCAKPTLGARWFVYKPKWPPSV